MTWSKRAVLTAALVAALVSQARAQVGGTPFELSAGAGIVSFDARAQIKDAPGFTASLGMRFTPWFALELPGLASLAKSRLDPSISHDLFFGGADLRWNFRPGENRV